jgi:SP family facilitated glucose transporter-like MFS transporter 8
LTFIETACQAGYTSTAEFEMMEDLGMSIAAVSFIYLFTFIYNWHSMATSNVSLIIFSFFFFIWLVLFPYILQYSFFGSIMTIGAAIGAILSGKMADFVGRKRVLL